jgi:predicted transcriptional regulator
MRVRQIVNALGLSVVAGRAALDAEVTGGYAADLLSCAMAGASAGNLWVTLQSHLNVVAVASLGDLAGVIITEGQQIGPDAVAKADEVNLPVLSTSLSTYQVVGRLWELGIR